MSGRVLTLSCVLLLAASPLAFGGPLNKKLVGAEATWVMHVDVEAAVASSIGKLIAEDVDGKAGIREVREQCGVDLLKDVKGITIWGVEGAEEDGVAVIHTTAVVDGLLEKYRGEGIEEVEEGGYELLKWDEGGEAHYGHIRKTRRGDDRMVFIARRAGDVVRSLEVADGDAPSAASGDAVIKDTPGENAIVFISVPEIAVLIPGEAAEVMPAFFGKISGVRFEAGERAGELFADGAVTAATSEDATTVQQAALGALAMCKMACVEDAKEFIKFADAIKISAQERTVKFSVRCDVDAVRGALEKAREHERRHETKIKARTETEEADDGDRDPDSPVAAPDKPRRKRGG